MRSAIRPGLMSLSRWTRAQQFIFGGPKDAREPGAFHKLSLVAFLAWVGLGADGLSSSAYGPEETFRQLGAHRGLAALLALAMVATVFIISYGYTRIIEQFPSGGGGFVVASRVLGPGAGVVAGSALLVDYVLTITISMAAGADAIFSFVSSEFHWLELPLSGAGVIVLTVMNLRGVKESVTANRSHLRAFSRDPRGAVAGRARHASTRAPPGIPRRDG